MAGVSRNAPAGSPVFCARLYDRAQVVAPQPLPSNAATTDPVGTNTVPSLPTLGVAVAGDGPSDPVQSGAPDALVERPDARVPPASTGSYTTPFATAGPMPLAAKPVGAAHNGVQTAVPSDDTQPVWPARVEGVHRAGTVRQDPVPVDDRRGRRPAAGSRGWR